jgi:predicted oxidoreductase (fatty acid repression mutant protein)
MSNAYIDAIKSRRSQYALGKELPLPQRDITALIQEAIKLSPSAFNSQSARAVILYGAESEKFWRLVTAALQKIVPADAFAATQAKIDSFAAGAGTVLFYEDQDIITGLQQQFALYADNFPVWSEQANGIAQFSVWTALANAGIGASLQHYNPLVDAVTAAQWQLPASWKLRAQMPFGANKGGHKDKPFINDEQRFRVFA